MGSLQWSPKLQEARDTILYYWCSISKKKGKKVSTRFLSQLAKKLQLEPASHETVEQLEKKLDAAFSHYKQIKIKHQEMRKSYLEDLAKAIADSGKVKQASVIKNLYEIEQTRSMFRRIAFVTKKNRTNMDYQWLLQKIQLLV